jgi:hypothetical protein
MKRLSWSVLVLTEYEQSCIWIRCVLVENNNRFGKDGIDGYRFVFHRKKLTKGYWQFKRSVWNMLKLVLKGGARETNSLIASWILHSGSISCLSIGAEDKEVVASSE